VSPDALETMTWELRTAREEGRHCMTDKQLALAAARIVSDIAAGAYVADRGSSFDGDAADAIVRRALADASRDYLSVLDDLHATALALIETQHKHEQAERYLQMLHDAAPKPGDVL
jgi:hypothetical protein